MPSGKKHGMYKHGHTINGWSKEFTAWYNMKTRCYNPSSERYYRYGARGIKVCDRWRNSFINFLKDIGYAPSFEHSLDRVDNDGDYEPSNCRWASRFQQRNNASNNRIIEFKGKKLNLCQWSRLLGIKRTTITQRLDSYGWCIEDALTKPIRVRLRK